LKKFYSIFPEIRFRNNVLKGNEPTPDHIINMAEELSLYSATVVETEQHFFGALPKGAIDSLCYLLAVYIYLPEDLDYFRALVL